MTLSRGVGKKTDVRSGRGGSRVDSVFSGGCAATRCLDILLDIRGVLTSSQGTAPVPLEDARSRKGPTHRKVPRFRTGRLAFDGRDA